MVEHLKNFFLLQRVTIATLSLVSFPSGAFANDLTQAVASDENKNIVVTARHRIEQLFDVPATVGVLTQDQLESLRASSLRQAARLIAGAYIVDQGARSATPIIFRGLNADPLGSFDDGNSGGGLVSTYVGEVPVYIDLRLKDIERIEFLLGAQGALYGDGSMSGAIKYIPRRPELDRWSGEFRTDIFSYRHGAGLSSDVGATVNIPLSPELAFRASIDRLDDRGFIDYPFIVRKPGLTNPNTFGEYIQSAKDLNTDKTISAKAAMRFEANDQIEADLAYFFQTQRTDGRQFSSARSNQIPAPIRKWESGLRVPEPNRRDNHLLSLETNSMLGSVKLTTISAYSSFSASGKRDQTDLLLTLDPAFAAFPNLTAMSEDRGKQDIFTQELRLASSDKSALQWLVGTFFSRKSGSSTSMEFTPGLDAFFVKYFGGTQLYPYNLEYYASAKSKIKQFSIYGDGILDFGKSIKASAGVRFFKYNRVTSIAIDSPLAHVVFLSRDPNVMHLDFQNFSKNGSGLTWRTGLSGRPFDNLLLYANVTTGFRIGGANTIPSCQSVALSVTAPCAQADEQEFSSDRTVNYELGFKLSPFNSSLTINGAAYFIDWRRPQLSSVTKIGAIPIIANGRGAYSKGFDISATWHPSRALAISASYAFSDPRLSQPTKNLVRSIEPPGFKPIYLDGEKDDRLPASPRHSGSICAEYSWNLKGGSLIVFAYNFYTQSNVYSTVGSKGNSYVLPGFAIHGTSLSFKSDLFNLNLYIDNIFDKFAETGARDIPGSNQVISNITGGPVYVRRFGTFALPPRSIGLRASLNF